MSIDMEQPRPKQRHIDFRRNQVLELSSQGRTEREIAQILKVGNSTVHRDIAYLNKQAQDNLKDHISQRLPAQFQRSLNGLDQVLKMAWNIVIIDSINQTIKL
jgi:transposase